MTDTKRRPAAGRSPSAGGVTVREARSDEYAALGEAVVAAYRAESVAEVAWYLDEIRKVAERAAAVPVLVAVDGESRVLGGVTYVPGPGPFAESERPDEAGFRMLGVAPWAQGRGVGRALVEACIARAQADGRRRLVLLTRREFRTAIALYERLGFTRAPARDWVPVPGVSLIGYELDLG